MGKKKLSAPSDPKLSVLKMDFVPSVNSVLLHTSGRNKEHGSTRVHSCAGSCALAEPVVPPKLNLWFWETLEAEALVLQHLVFWWRWDPSTFRKLVLLLIPKYSYFWTRNNLFNNRFFLLRFCCLCSEVTAVGLM